MNEAQTLIPTRTAHAISRWCAAVLLLGLVGLISACGSSSTSFVSINSPTTTGTVTSISVEPANASLPRGLTRQFSATALYSNGTKLDVSSTVTWSSNTPNVATINGTGLLTAVNLGATTVTATLGSVSGSTTLTVIAATLVSIDITPAGPTIASGSQLQLTATGIYTDYSTQNLTGAVTWASATPLVATINTAGVATGLAAGTSMITATLAGASGSTLLTVNGATLTSISVTPANSSQPLGLQQQFTATGTYSNGTQQNLTTFVTWSSSTGAATISNAAGSQGLASTAATGTTTITATLNGVAGATGFTVTPAALVSIAVTPANPSIAAGTTQQFTATGTYTDGRTANITTMPMVVWSSSNPAIATIGNTPTTDGLAQANNAGTTGTTVITATSGTIVSPGVTLTVTPATLVSIAVTPVNPTLVVGATLQFVATGTYSDGATQVITGAVTWNSATPAVASIGNAAGPPSNQGLATAVSPGTTLITATYPGTTVTSPPQTLTVKSAYAYATNTAAPGIMGTVSQYSIGGDGTLSALTPDTVAAGINAFSIAINPAGTFAYVANYNKSGNPALSTISQYSISQVDGTLNPIGTPVVTASTPNSVTIDPLGHYLYVSNNSETDVSEYVIQADGTLANPPGVIGVGGAIFQSGAGPASIAINPADTFAYVANYNDGTVSQYVIGAGGALAAIPGEPAAVPAGGAGGGSSYVIVDPTGHYVYVANEAANSISEYSIQGDGSLVNIGTATAFNTGNSPSFIAIDATGRYAYVADSNSEDVSQYNIVNGILTPMTIPSVTTGPGSVPYGVTIDSTGRYLYVAERITAGVISQFAISQVDGSLMPLTPPTSPAGAAPTSIATTP